MSYKYCFYDIPDIRRIIREAKEDAREEDALPPQVIVVTAEGTNPRLCGSALLLIHRHFLRQFSLEDGVPVFQEPLHRDWGVSRFEVATRPGFFVFFGGIGILIPTYRGYAVSQDHLGKLHAEIKQARLFLEAREKANEKVKVHYW